MVYKAYGCIVVDTETRSIKSVHIPVILDLVQDRVRSRVYSVLLTLLIVIAAGYWALGPALRFAHFTLPPLEVAEVAIVLPESATVSYGGVIDPPPMLVVLASDGTPLSGREVYAFALPDGTDDMDDFYLWQYNSLMVGTLQLKTNSAGTVLFTNISFYGNPQITYNLFFECEEIFSTSLPISITSDVASLMITSIPLYPLTPLIGSPVDFTFIIAVSDADNNMLSGKNVTANITPFPEPQMTFPRYGLLDNSVVVTDADGLAIFNNITILMANQNTLSFQFYCEGVMLTPNYTELAINFITNVAQVQVTVPPPSSVEEGSFFPDNTVITVLDINGNPLVDKYVTAMVTLEAGVNAYPKVFVYSKILSTSNVALTDENGRATLDSLEFSQGGRAGMYGLTFFCDGVASDQQLVYVQTTVTKVLWLSTPPQVVNLISNSPFFDEFIAFTIKALDQYNQPIESKMVEVAGLYDWGTATIGMEKTDYLGVATILVTRIPYYDSPNYTFVAICDGVMSSVNVTLESNSTAIPFSTYSVYLQAIVPPSGTYSTTNTNGVQPRFRAVDYLGRPASNLNISVSLINLNQISTVFPYYNPYYVTPFPQSYLLTSSAITDEDGILQYGASGNPEFGVFQGATGTIVIYFADSSSLYLSVSEVFLLQVESPVSQVKLGHHTSLKHPNTYPAYPDVPLNLTVTVSLKDNSLQGREDIYPSIMVMTGPSYGSDMLEIFNGSGSAGVPFISSVWLSYQSDTPCSFNSSDVGVCTFGDMATHGFPGTFGVVVGVAGVLSNILTITMMAYGVIYPVPAPVAAFNVSLLEDVPIPAYVTLASEYDSSPIVGVYLLATVCDHPEITIVNMAAAAFGCRFCSLSSPTNESGVAVFENLFFMSGESGIYQICYYVGLPDYLVAPVRWDVSINLTNPIYSIDILSSGGIITPGGGTNVLTVHIAATQDFSLVPHLIITSDNGLDIMLSTPFCSTNYECLLLYKIDHGADGYYTAVVEAGGIYSDNFTIVLNSVPTSLQLDATNTGVSQLMLFEPLTVNINAVSINPGVNIQNVNYTLSLTAQPNGTVPASLYYVQNWVLDKGTILSIIFTAGVSGQYQVLIKAGAVSTSISVNITNQIQNISVVNADKLQTAVVAEFMPVQPILLVETLPGYKGSIVGRSVNAVLLNTKGNTLVYKTKPSVDEDGMAYFTDLTLMVAIPGTYYIQFEMDGIVSAPVPIQLDNPAFPNFENLNLHHAQVRVVLAVLVVIPLFIGNSARQPAWQLVVSIPAFAVIGYIAYSNVFIELVEKKRIMALGYAYYALDMSMRGIIALTVIVFFLVVGMVIYGLVKKKPTSFFETKVNACRSYIRHELLFYGMKRYDQNQIVKGVHNTVPEEHPPLLTRIKLGFKSAFQFFGKRKKLKRETGFFFPQRLFIGFGTSLVCAFFVACGAMVLSNYLSQLFDTYEARTVSIISVLQQLQDFIQAGGSSNLSRQQLFSVADLIQMSPDKLTQLAGSLSQQSTETFQYMRSFDIVLKSLKVVLRRSSLIALGVSCGVVIVSWFFVFRTYKRRVFYLRKGRLDMITRNTQKYTIDRAAVYVGLQAVHASIGFFILWIWLTLLIVAVQSIAFWQWIESYYPVLVAFLLGLPFISKTITKFIVSQWILKNEVILHLRLYLIFDFMWIFINMLSSIVLSVIRILFSMVSSVIYAMRMDNPLLRDEFDYMDYGFRAYLGMMLMDHKNNNPVLLQFTTLLIDKMKLKRKERKERILQRAKHKMREVSVKHEILPLLTPVEEQGDDGESDQQTIRSPRIINKWWLLITLHNNPSLIPLRRYSS